MLLNLFFGNFTQNIQLNMLTVPPEKLGSFYLGAKYDHSTKTIGTEPVNYDSRDLTTHAVCVGMTGSGKTGLCIGLLEEAAMDKVPALIIDPKGDMTNLLLQFETLDPEDFKKWINPDDAARKGMSIDEFAKYTANKWKNGLADWGQGTERIQNLKNSVEYTLYTPGSDSGIPVNIMGSFASPGIDFDSDSEMLRERIQGTVAALLGMLNSKADPVRSREGILLATIFEHYWRKNEDLDLGKLIIAVQTPPIKKLGVFDVDTFFPEKDRFDLAMSFNTLMASPQFQYWLQGDPLDIDKLYFTKEGKPRHSIFYIAHLSDSERMFFVTLLLNSLISWMRRQSGTSSLRSLLYFDEIFGYFPPTSQPPSKKPLLTILKQARAFGVGAVLVTQNPVDIDYKGLSNAGTWFIGKLQTERDKMRVLEGLQGAIAEAGGSAEKDFSNIISSLSSRVFLMHNVHDDAPTIYHTRWAMSYLRGPLTRPQVKKLMKDRKVQHANQKSIPESQSTGTTNLAESAAVVSPPQSKAKSVVNAGPPSIDPSIDQRYFSVWKSATEAKSELNYNGDLSLNYEAHPLVLGKVRFFDGKRNVDEVEEKCYLCPSPDDFGRVDWDKAHKVVAWEMAIQKKADHPDNIPVNFSDIPSSMNNPKELNKIEKEFSEWLYQEQSKIILEHSKLELFQQPKESDEAFRMRVQQKAREIRDDEMDELKDRFEPKFERIQDRIRKEQQDLEEAEADAKHRKRAEWIGMAETVFSVFVKRRSRSISAATTKSRMRQKANQKVEASEDDLRDLREDYIELEEQLQSKLTDLRLKWDAVIEGISSKEIKPRRSDVKVDGVIMTWQPFWMTDRGDKVSARRN